MILETLGQTDRRQSPRYEVKLLIDLVLENGAIVTVTSRNISSQGLQVICDSWVTDEIEPRGIQNHAISHIRFKAVTELSVGKNTKKLYSNCRITSVQRMSQDEFMLNLAFVDFENGTERVLDGFLDQYLQKKTIIKDSA